MRQHTTNRMVSVALAVGEAGASAANPDAALTLPRVAALADRWNRLRRGFALRKFAGLLALASLLAGTLAVVLVASAGPTVLVPRSPLSFPSWMSGPLHGLIAPVTARNKDVSLDLSVVIVGMALAYGVALAAVRVLSTRMLIATVVALHVILLMSPPLQLEDVFNYLGYARLGGLHGLNPYTHVIASASHDPIYKFTTWANLKSPYGPLFTAATYPLALLPLPVAYWIVKIAAVLASLGFLALCWHCARRLGRDPRFVLVFIALNPIYLIYAVGGFHNDFFMIGAAMAAVTLILHGRERAAGAALMVAVAIKFSVILILPFLLLAVPTGARRIRVVVGAVLASIPLAALSVALFGFALPNLATQDSLLTSLSVPNLVGDVIGAGGGAPWLLHVADLCVVAVVVWLVVRNRDWVSGAGWASLALLLSLGWLLPWYIVWVLPFAALGASTRLRKWTLAMSAFLIITFIPSTSLFLAAHNVNTLNGPAGIASFKRQAELAK